jgi:hypothetical protein
MTGRTLHGALAVLLLFMAVVAAAAPVSAQPRRSCTVKITRYRFRPDSVHPGEWARLRLVAMNCTDRTLDLHEVEYGEQIPPCPTIDPIGGPVRLDPHERFAPKPLRILAPDCDGVEVVDVAFTNHQGHVLAQGTATLDISP